MSNLNLTQEKLEALRSEYKHRNVRGKYPRQKMLPEYQSLYPWVLPDETDPYFAFCTVCECRLSAKRSDLGKHEGSMKHTENASKKGCLGQSPASLIAEGGAGVVLKGSHSQLQQPQLESQAVGTEANGVHDVASDDDDDSRDVGGDDNDDQREDFLDDDVYIKQEPEVQLVETSDTPINLDENQCTRDFQDFHQNAFGDTADDEEGDDDDDDDDDDDETCAPLPPKRRPSEADYFPQHSSSILDPQSLKMTVADASSVQRLSIREAIPPTQYFTSSIHSTSNQYKPHGTPSLAPAQTPCKITIKKISAPIVTPPIHPALPSIPSTAAAKIMPASTSISISKQATHQLIAAPSTRTAVENIAATSHDAISKLPSFAVPTTGMTSATVRDSFELFFDSICASVKALPPKLATEGKIRVMQLVGELELRAIAEREQTQAQATGQQNSTVASTTK